MAEFDVRAAMLVRSCWVEDRMKKEHNYNQRSWHSRSRDITSRVSLLYSLQRSVEFGVSPVSKIIFVSSAIFACMSTFMRTLRRSVMSIVDWWSVLSIHWSSTFVMRDILHADSSDEELVDQVGRYELSIVYRHIFLFLFKFKKILSLKLSFCNESCRKRTDRKLSCYTPENHMIVII
jgi:hypothetical protein